MKNTAQDASGTGVKWVKMWVRVAAINSISRDRTMARCRVVFMVLGTPDTACWTTDILTNWTGRGLIMA